MKYLRSTTLGYKDIEIKNQSLWQKLKSFHVACIKNENARAKQLEGWGGRQTPPPQKLVMDKGLFSQFPSTLHTQKKI